MVKMLKYPAKGDVVHRFNTLSPPAENWTHFSVHQMLNAMKDKCNLTNMAQVRVSTQKHINNFFPMIILTTIDIAQIIYIKFSQ